MNRKKILPTVFIACAIGIGVSRIDFGTGMAIIVGSVVAGLYASTQH